MFKTSAINFGFDNICFSRLLQGFFATLLDLIVEQKVFKLVNLLLLDLAQSKTTQHSG